MNQDNLLSLDEMWMNAEARFNNRTGIALQSKSVTWLHCIEEIEKMQNSDESPAADDRFENAKKWGVRIVECLRLVGGVAAKAAGTVRLLHENYKSRVLTLSRSLVHPRCASTPSLCCWIFRCEFATSTKQLLLCSKLWGRHCRCTKYTRTRTSFRTFTQKSIEQSTRS